MLKFIVFGLLLASCPVFGQIKPISDDSANRIADAIFRIEGGKNTKYPYGIKSIKTNNPRQVCINTIKNNYIRWQKAWKTNDFIEFLGARFCPVGAKDDPNNLNKNWVKNLKSVLNKDKKI